MSKYKLAKSLQKLGKKAIASPKLHWAAVIMATVARCDFCAKKSHYGAILPTQSMAFVCPRCAKGLGLLNYKHLRYLSKCWHTHVPPGLNSSNAHLSKFQPMNW